MALVHNLSFSTPRECLKEFDRVFGKHPPRDPIPEWWEKLGSRRTGEEDLTDAELEKTPWWPDFVKWYRTLPVRASGTVRICLRTEPWDDEESEEDENESLFWSEDISNEVEEDEPPPEE